MSTNRNVDSKQSIYYKNALRIFKDNAVSYDTINDEDQKFEIFSSDFALKNDDFELSIDELQEGILGGSLDGGVDGFYVFVNGHLVNDDNDYKDTSTKSVISVYIIQSKNKSNRESIVLEKFKRIADDFFDAEDNIESDTQYSDEVKEKVKRLHSLRRKNPNLRKAAVKVFFIYSFLGDSRAASADQTFRSLKDKIIESVKNSGFAKNISADLKYFGAREIVDVDKRRPEDDITLKLQSHISGDNEGYLSLVSLYDYFNFISQKIDDEYKLRIGIFDENVRAYQGANSVNKEIEKSLSELLENPHSDNKHDFWWLNNGITIISNDIHIAGKEFTLTDPQIVNGMQTSNSIYNIMSRMTEDQRKVAKDYLLLVRIFNATEDGEVRDKVIKATNSQTKVDPASLFATSSIHRDIEYYFKNASTRDEYPLYYDRRKNFYKNQGHPISEIISIEYLAQSVAAIILGKANKARSGKASLIRDSYKNIFIESYDEYLDVYHWVALTQRRIEIILKDSYANIDPKKYKNLSAVAYTDAKKYSFYISRFYAIMGLGFIPKEFKDLKKLTKNFILPTEDKIFSALNYLVGIANSEVRSTGKTLDNVIKSSTFATKVDLKAQQLIRAAKKNA